MINRNEPGRTEIRPEVQKAIYAKWIIALASVLAAQVVMAQSDTTSYLELSSHIKSPSAVEKIGSDLFGDQVNLYNGSLEFSQTDIDLLGNNALRVMAGRRLVAGVDNRGSRAFGMWDLEIPHLHGVFSYKDGWRAPN